MAVLFDTLQMVETLQAGGFTDQQAKTLTAALGSAATVAQVATRGDVMDLGIGIKHDFEVFKTEMQAALAAHETEMQGTFAAHRIEMQGTFAAHRTEMQGTLAAHKTEMNNRIEVLMKDMTLRLGGIVIGCGAVVSVLQHFWR